MRIRKFTTEQSLEMCAWLPLVFRKQHIAPVADHMYERRLGKREVQERKKEDVPRILEAPSCFVVFPRPVLARRIAIIGNDFLPHLVGQSVRIVAGRSCQLEDGIDVTIQQADEGEGVTNTIGLPHVDAAFYKELDDSSCSRPSSAGNDNRRGFGDFFSHERRILRFRLSGTTDRGEIFSITARSGRSQGAGPQASTYAVRIRPASGGASLCGNIPVMLEFPSRI